MATATQRIEQVRDRALELGLYLPLGAYSAVRDEIADLDTTRLRKAYDGLVDRGQTRLQPVERVVRRRARKAQSATARTAKRTAARTTKKATAAAAGIAPKLPRVAAPKKASELPIPGYGSLTASEITTRLSGLTQTDLARVYKYEKAHENRSTILETIESRLVDLPIPTFDALTVDEIRSRLEKLSQGELKTIRRYESETKGRNTVIEKIDALLAA